MAGGGHRKVDFLVKNKKGLLLIAYKHDWQVAVSVFPIDLPFLSKLGSSIHWVLKL